MKLSKVNQVTMALSLFAGVVAFIQAIDALARDQEQSFWQLCLISVISLLVMFAISEQNTIKH